MNQGFTPAQASLLNIPGLGSSLQNQGWQVIAAAGTGMNLSLAGGTNTFSSAMRTTRMNVLPTYSATHVVLAFGNYSGNVPSGQGETAGMTLGKIHVSLEYSALGSETSETNNRIPVTFGGKRWAEVFEEGIVLSDPVPFSVTAGVPFFVRTNMSSSGSNLPVLGGYYTSGGNSPGGVSTIGEGYGNYDAVDAGTITQLQSAVTYGPSAILGYSTSKLPSAAIMGDSITAGTADGGMPGANGGYLHRAMSGQLTRVYTYPVTPPVAYVKCAHGGEYLSNFATAIDSYRRMRLLEMPSTAVCEYGRNDLSVNNLAAVQANYIIVANWFLSRGKSFVGCTLVPNTSSTDGFMTTANQTQMTSEATRQGFNTWLRSGAMAAATINPGKVSVFDAAAPVEINSAGVQTLNGGYWKLAGTAIVTGTFTSVTSTILMQDSSKTFTQDQYKGYTLYITSGAAAGTQTDIVSVSTTGIYSLVTLTGLIQPSVGDSYEIHNSYTAEGIHPTALGHMTIAATFPISLIK